MACSRCPFPPRRAGNPAALGIASLRPVTLRPRLSDGLALFSSSRLARCALVTGYGWDYGVAGQILSTF